jgi:hypothetical protein
MLVAPVVVDHRVSLPTMRVAVSDACEFTDNDRRHALPVKVLDELTNECGYGMSETVLPDPVES